MIAGHNTVGAEWLAPTSNGGAPILGYRIQLSLNGTNWLNFSWWQIPNTAQAFAQYNHQDTWIELYGDSEPLSRFVAPGRRLWLRVAAVNEAGLSPWTSFGSVIPYTYPGPPQRLRGVPSSGAISLSWQPPAATGGRAITRYEIQVAVWGTNWWRTVGTTSGLGFKATGLRNGGHWCVHVIAWNTGGLGTYGNPIAFYAGSWRAYDPYGQGCRS